MHSLAVIFEVAYLDVVPLDAPDQRGLVVSGSTPSHDNHFSSEKENVRI